MAFTPEMKRLWLNGVNCLKQAEFQSKSMYTLGEKGSSSTSSCKDFPGLQGVLAIYPATGYQWYMLAFSVVA